MNQELRSEVAKLVILIETTKLDCRDLPRLIQIKNLANSIKKSLPDLTPNSKKFTQQEMFK